MGVGLREEFEKKVGKGEKMKNFGMTTGKGRARYKRGLIDYLGSIYKRRRGLVS